MQGSYVEPQEERIAVRTSYSLQDGDRIHAPNSAVGMLGEVLRKDKWMQQVRTLPGLIEFWTEA